MKIKYLLLILILYLLFTIPVNAEYYPLVVYSGEPEGVLAAVSAARNGVKTLLIMKREHPGGLMTYGNLNYLDLSYGPEGNLLGNPLFQEWHRKVGEDVSFSVNNAVNVFEEMLSSENNLTLLRNYELIDLTVDKNQITKLKIQNSNAQVTTITADRFIDASQNADLAVRAGAPYFYGGADIGLPERTMAATLILTLANINFKHFQENVNTDKYGPSYLRNNHAWGFIKLGRIYKQRNDNVRLRGLNIVFTGNKKTYTKAYINALLLFNVKLNPEKDYSQLSPAEAYQLGKEEARYVLQHLRENLAGFENAVLLDFPEELYIRESRHIIARYQLKTSDLLTNKIFYDTIALAGYPLDYQASNPDYDGFVLFNPIRYGIPFRSLIPLNIDNLLVTGRSAGYSSLAAASARVLPAGMSSGEAAGIAAALSLKNNIYFPEITARKDILHILQDKLAIDNSLLNTVNNLINDYTLLPYLNELISWGLIIGGYDNNFRLEETISEKIFAHLLIKGLKRKKAEIFYEWIPGGLNTLSSDQALSRDKAAELLLAAISQPLAKINSNNYETAIAYNLIPEVLKNDLAEKHLLNRREAYIIAGHFLQQYNPEQEIQFYRGKE